MWSKVLFLTGSLLLTQAVAAVIYLMLPKQHCVCGVKIPEGGGMCECGEYNSWMIIKIDGKDELRERELKRIEEELKRIEEELKRIKEELKIKDEKRIKEELKRIEEESKRIEEELKRIKEEKRIEEEKRKGNSYDTFL